MVNGKVTKDIEYLSAIDEEKYTIAQANSPINKDGTFGEELVSCRNNLNFLTYLTKKILIILMYRLNN